MPVHFDPAQDFKIFSAQGLWNMRLAQGPYVVVLIIIHESGTGKRHRLEQMFRHRLEQKLRHRGGTGAHSATVRDNGKNANAHVYKIGLGASRRVLVGS